MRPNACLHGADEAGREARRRVSAIAYVRAINTAQAEFFARSSRYAESGELAALGGVPAGFVLQHASRGSNYMVSLKDRQDPCGYTLYSDHTGVVYEAAPVAPEAPGP